ncbi:hypothetical protein V1288_004026 [Bradyrhizobium sp. AZCC 2176]
MVNVPPLAAAPRFHVRHGNFRSEEANRSRIWQKLLARAIGLRKHLSLAIVFSPAVDAMLVWILISACWAGLLLLILHDATRDADGGSAVSVASRNALFTAAKGWRRLRKLRRYATSPKAGPSEAPAQTSLATIQSQATEPSKKTWWRRDRRAQITPAELELTIAEAIRKSAPGCKNFVGVIVHHKKPRQYRDPNWGIRGVKFGKADRRIVDETLARIVEQLQKEFLLVDPQLRN